MARRRTRRPKGQAQLRSEHLSRVRRIVRKVREGKVDQANVAPDVKPFVDDALAEAEAKAKL